MSEEIQTCKSGVLYKFPLPRMGLEGKVLLASRGAWFSTLFDCVMSSLSALSSDNVSTLKVESGLSHP